MKIVRALPAVPLLIALAAGSLVAGCGSKPAPSGAKPASSVIQAMDAAVNHAKSVHMVGVVRYRGAKIGFDLRFHGSRLAGKMHEGDASFGVIVLPGRTYLRVNSAFLTKVGIPAAACAKICGKYILLTVANAKPFTGTISMNRLTREFFGKIAKSARKLGVFFKPATYGGQPVLRVHRSGYTLDVAATGTPYPLVILAPHGQYLKFDDWNNVRSPAAPAKSKVITPSQLAQIGRTYG